MTFFDAHGALCYARSLTSFGCINLVVYLSLGLMKVKPHLIAIDDICEGSIVVLRELFQHLSEQFFALLLGDLVSMWHLSFSFLNHV
jgi:hypothetical protein